MDMLAICVSMFNIFWGLFTDCVDIIAIRVDILRIGVIMLDACADMLYIHTYMLDV